MTSRDAGRDADSDGATGDRDGGGRGLHGPVCRLCGRTRGAGREAAGGQTRLPAAAPGQFAGHMDTALGRDMQREHE